MQRLLLLLMTALTTGCADLCHTPSPITRDRTVQLALREYEKRRASETTITGKAVDARGRPCANGYLTALWEFPDPHDERTRLQVDHTDERGRFKISGPGVPSKITVWNNERGVETYGEVVPHSTRDILIVVR